MALQINLTYPTDTVQRYTCVTCKCEKRVVVSIGIDESSYTLCFDCFGKFGDDHLRDLINVHNVSSELASKLLDIMVNGKE